MSVAVTLANNLATTATVFFRARGVTHASLKSDFSDNLVGSKNNDCSKGGTVAGVPCANDDTTTLYFLLAQSESVDLFFRAGDVARSAVIWAVPEGATRVTAGGPFRESQAEFDLASSEIFFDATFVEGVTSGVRVAYTPAGASVPEKVANAVPSTPLGRYNVQIARVNNVPVILADKHTEPDLARRVLAECPASLANTACGQHRCRVYYADLVRRGRSYCNWIRDSGVDAYCWAMDEMECTDPSCGYGGVGQPAQLADGGMGAGGCVVPDQVNRGLEAPLWPANDYSCGAITNLPQPHMWTPGSPSPTTWSGTEVWWASSVGCTPRLNTLTSREPLQRVVRGAGGGALVISFENLPWLTGQQTTVSPAGAKPLKYDPLAPPPADRTPAEPAAWRVPLAIFLIVLFAFAVIAIVAAAAASSYKSSVATALAGPHSRV